MSDNKKITDGRGRNGDGIIDAEFVEIGQEPVSYTHLDVYKRQFLPIARRIAPRASR